MKILKCILCIICFSIFFSSIGLAQSKPKIFLRFKVSSPVLTEKVDVQISGFRHRGEDWYFPGKQAISEKNEWSNWIDLSDWNWHGKLNRSGGIAEWCSVRIVAANPAQLAKNVSFDVEISDSADEKKPLVSFSEKASENVIVFLVPYPLRENVREFETGSQMAARHTKWAREATGNKPINLKNFEFITSLWGHYDSALEKQEASNLKMLGFQSVGNLADPTARELGLRPYGVTWLYSPDAEAVDREWKNFVAGNIKNATGDAAWRYSAMRHFVIADEVSGLNFNGFDTNKLNTLFRDFLRFKSVNDEDLEKPVSEIEFPLKTILSSSLPEDEPLKRRKLYYYAAKFSQFFSAKQIRQISNLILTDLPHVKTEILFPSHGFFGNAWSPAHIGMSYKMLDFFEVGAQQSVKQFSAEDWLGLNHMYWSDYTWTGGQTFGYFNALLRSAAGNRPIELRGLITPSDEKYLLLKAHSSIGQGAKSFFFWTYGPTYIGTENYWSDLKSQYDGIAKLGRTLEKTEDVLADAKTVSDDVAIAYSVSHDIWNTDNHTAFVEKRLLWHALKHLQIQPDFLREEDLQEGKLSKYKILFLTDWYLSRQASASIDAWVKAGGTLYLSAGAATRDEFGEPFAPPFAEAVWGKNAAQNLISEQHAYNERKDLPKIKPLTDVSLNIHQKTFSLPAIGARQNLIEQNGDFAKFADGKTAGVKIAYGRGQIIAVGFMPMLAYGAAANFKPETLEEKWQPEARELIKFALDTAKISPVVKSDLPVVQADLLESKQSSALILANYTYQPIKLLNLDVKLKNSFGKAFSAEGKPVKTKKLPDGTVRVSLPLDWTDIVIFK